METQICSQCGEEKKLNEFYFRKDTGKYRNDCKECRKVKDKNYREKNKEKVKAYQQEYRENHRQEAIDY